MCREIKSPTNNSSDKAAAAARTKQLDGEIKTYLIDDAINALGGAFPTATTPKVAGGYFMSGDVLMVDLCASNLPICTRAEFESRKAERQGKPDWRDAPDWAQWLFQDRTTGGWWFLDGKPMVWPFAFGVGFGKLSMSGKGEVIGNWQDTLEQRPEAKGTNPYDHITDWMEARAKSSEKTKPIAFEPWSCLEIPAKADWYNYDNQQALKLPPVGVECIVLDDVHARIIGATASGYLVYQNLSTGHCEMACQSTSFRPLDWERNNPKVEPEQSPELSFHLATAENELTASAKLLPAESKMLQSITGVIGAIQAIREAV